MKKQILQSCTFLVLGLAAMQTAARADDGTSAIEGVWFTTVTPINCPPSPSSVITPTGAPSFRALTMFGHDGSVTNTAAFLTSTVPRSSGLGAWQHTQGHMYTATFRFFRYNPDGSFLSMRRVTLTITMIGDQFTSFDRFQDFDANNNPLPAAGCNVETGRME